MPLTGSRVVMWQSKKHKMAELGGIKRNREEQGVEIETGELRSESRGAQESNEWQELDMVVEENREL